MCGKVETRRGRKKKRRGEGLFSLREDVFEIHAGPADRTCFGRESDRAAFYAPAEPIEKLFFLAFDNHWIASNTKGMSQCMMRIQFVCKPARPFRDAGNSVDVGNGSPNKVSSRTSQ